MSAAIDRRRAPPPRRGCGSGCASSRSSRLIEGELRERLRERFDTTLPRFDVLAALHRAPRRA